MTLAHHRCKKNRQVHDTRARMQSITAIGKARMLYIAMRARVRKAAHQQQKKKEQS